MNLGDSGIIDRKPAFCEDATELHACVAAFSRNAPATSKRDYTPMERREGVGERRQEHRTEDYGSDGLTEGDVGLGRPGGRFMRAVFSQVFVFLPCWACPWQTSFIV